jgi:hypothetical protein
MEIGIHFDLFRFIRGVECGNEASENEAEKHRCRATSTALAGREWRGQHFPKRRTPQVKSKRGKRKEPLRNGDFLYGRFYAHLCIKIEK